MTFIIAKNKEDLIKILKKTGDDIVIVKEETVYAFPKGMYKQQEKQIKENLNNYSYYRVRSFPKKFKVEKTGKLHK